MKTKTILAFGVAIAALLLITVTGCKKENEAPVVTITSPDDEQEFMSGSAVTLTATATDDDELHELHVELLDHDADTLIMEWDPMVHGEKSYTFTYTFSPTVADTMEYHFEVTASDMDGKTADKERHFMVMP